MGTELGNTNHLVPIAVKTKTLLHLQFRQDFVFSVKLQIFKGVLVVFYVLVVATGGKQFNSWSQD